MNTNNNHQIEENLKKEITENNNKINNLTEKINIFDVNTSQKKLVPLSFISTSTSLLLTGALCGISYITMKSNILFCSLPIILSLSFGRNTMKRWSNENQKKLRKISPAKTEQEIIEELEKHIIERQKYKEKHKVLTNILSKVKNKTSPLENTSNNSTSKEDIRTIEEIQTNIENLNNKLQEYYYILDIYNKKYILNKLQNLTKVTKKETFKNIFYSGLMTLTILGLPFVCHFTLNPSIYAIIYLLSTPIIGITIGSIYKNNQIKNYQKVFEKLNDELEENKLQTNTNQKELEQQIDKILKDISEIKLQLEQEKVSLSNKIDTENSKKELPYTYIPSKSKSIEVQEEKQELTESKEKAPVLKRKK